MPTAPVPDPAAAVASLVARRLALRDGEFAVIGLGRSGRAVGLLLRAAGVPVYASDAGAGAAVAEAARALRDAGAAVEVGGHDLARIAAAAVVVVSPGVPPESPPLRAAAAAGVPVASEIEVALRLAPGLRVIATTGTNGKTTTTALIGHFLRALGHDAVDAGNIGTPLAEVVRRQPLPSWVALEISSFQLHDTPGLDPDVGVLTTLSPDHLDRYPSVAAYYADKARLFANASARSRWVVSGDNADVAAMVADVPGRVARFSTAQRDVDAFLDREGGLLHVLGAPLAPRDRLPLAGDHNVANALAALLAVMLADPAHATDAARARLAAALATVRALPHRLEPVAEVGGVLWLNDSKATNVASARVAIEGMTRPTVLLLGGRHKGEPYHGLVDGIRRHARAVIAYGEACDRIAADLAPALAGQVPLRALPGAPFDEVIAVARAHARPGDAVLLSPACASYDMFANYEERGRRFAELARAAAP